MELIVTLALCLVLLKTAFILALRFVLKGSIPVRGKCNIPGPGYTLPFIGDAWRFACARNMKEFLDTMESVFLGADRAVSIWMGPKLMVFVKDPAMGETIMNSSRAVNKDPDVYYGFNQFGDGVFSRNGKGWRDLRRPLNRLLQPAHIMGNYYATFCAKSEELCDALNGMCGKGECDILRPIQNCSLDIVFETLLGIPGISETVEDADLDMVNRLVSISLQMALNPLYKFQSLMRWSALHRETERILCFETNWVKRFHESRMKILEGKSINPDDPNFEPDCFIDVAYQVTKNEPPQNEFRALSKPLDLMAAGYDTSSVALTSAILFLAMHPEYQERAYREQINILGNALRAPTEEEIAKMDYLLMAFQETIRHVGVPGFFRLLTAEIVIDDYVFPEGTSVYLSVHSFNVNPEYWEKPKEFYPDHFLPGNVAERPKAAYLPFSSGPRCCPGKTYSHTSSKVILSMLLRRFEFKTSLKWSEMEYKYMLMLESTKGYPVQLEKRSFSAA